MISLLRGLMSSDGSTNRPFPSLILLGIVDFCCILIGLEQVSVHKIASGTAWIFAGIGSGLIGYNWPRIKQGMRNLVATVTARSKKEPSKLVIHSANYRAIESGGQTCDVSEFLRRIISRNSLVFDIENHNFVLGSQNFVPTDPFPMKPKRLQVTYSYSGEDARTIVRYEHGRLVLPEDSEAQNAQKWREEISHLQAKYASDKANNLNEKAQAENKATELQAKLTKLEQESVAGLSPLQKDALQLSRELLDFLKRLGPPPTPKYTAKELHDMTSAQFRKLIDANDGDFIEANEYYRPGSIAFTRKGLENQTTVHMTRLLPWYQKVEAAYALTFKSKVETIRNRFAVEGMANDVLLVSVEGRDGEKNVRAIAAKLWELAL